MVQYKLSAILMICTWTVLGSDSKPNPQLEIAEVSREDHNTFYDVLPKLAASALLHYKKVTYYSVNLTSIHVENYKEKTLPKVNPWAHQVASWYPDPGKVNYIRDSNSVHAFISWWLNLAYWLVTQSY